MYARLIIFILLMLKATHGVTQMDCPPVRKLRTLLDHNLVLRMTVDSMLVNVHPLPDGTDNYWKNKTVVDLYIFLNRWFYKLPTVSNGLEDILLFSQLYYRNEYGLKFVDQEPGLSWTLDFVKEQGKFMDSRESIGSIPLWLADSSLHNYEYVRPSNGYSSFNEFFTRTLKPGMRPIARPLDDAVIVSPVDGSMVPLNVELTSDSTFPVKGRMRLNLNQLLGNSPLAYHFIDGSAFSIFLLPKNYHHFHSPVEGVLLEANADVGQALFGSQIMDFFATGTTDFSVFENYKHGYFIFKTKNFGYVALVAVGLETVGSVIFEKRVNNVISQHPILISKGEKLGHFAYGGSMVMLLFEKNRMSAFTVQQGQQIAVFH